MVSFQMARTTTTATPAQPATSTILPAIRLAENLQSLLAAKQTPILAAFKPAEKLTASMSVSATLAAIAQKHHQKKCVHKSEVPVLSNPSISMDLTRIHLPAVLVLDQKPSAVAKSYLTPASEHQHYYRRRPRHPRRTVMKCRWTHPSRAPMSREPL